MIFVLALMHTEIIRIVLIIVIKHVSIRKAKLHVYVVCSE